MSAMASQITGVSIVCSTACSGAEQRKHQISTSLAFVKGIHRSILGGYPSLCLVNLSNRKCAYYPSLYKVLVVVEYQSIIHMPPWQQSILWVKSLKIIWRLRTRRFTDFMYGYPLLQWHDNGRGYQDSSPSNGTRSHALLASETTVKKK